MKLILLPGMDGSGLLFGPLLNRLGSLDTEVIPLPSEGAQDYSSLAEKVAALIGDQECVVLAESYSGGIVEILLKKHNLQIRHVIFVASFLSCPSRTLSRVAAVLPIRALMAIPVLAPLAMKVLLIGRSASPDTISLLRRAINAVDQKVLKRRLQQIAKYRATDNNFETHATYIRPVNDALVGDRTREFRDRFPHLKVINVGGPHFILQAQPDACAERILAEVGHLTSKGKGAA